MNSKRRKLPLEVSSWMDKDVVLRKISANSRLMTNDTRQNIVLSRQFFSNMLTLSFARYRKITEYDFDKRMFLKNQRNKSEISMPGLLPYIDQLTFNMDRGTSSRIQSSRKDGNSLLYPSAQSSFSRPETNSDPAFNRRQQSSKRQPMKSQLDITPTANPGTPTNQRPSSRQQMSRERLNRLALPKGYYLNSGKFNHVRSNASGTTTTAENVFGKIEQASLVSSSPMNNSSYYLLPNKPKSSAEDKRFRHLVGVFSEVHETDPSKSQTVKSIIQSNPSLQDDEGQWKMAKSSTASRKSQLKHHRQALAEKLHNRVDVFLIDVGA